MEIIAGNSGVCRVQRPTGGLANAASELSPCTSGHLTRPLTLSRFCFGHLLITGMKAEE